MMRALSVAALFLAFAVPADAAVHIVDLHGMGDALTIQEGLAAAAAGDTVLVLPGTYTGPDNRDLDFAGDAVLLVSQEGAAETVIDCEASGRAFLFDDGEGADAVVRGFTLKNGVSHPENGAGILVTNGSSPTVEDCVIRNCDSGISFGGGVAVISAHITLRRCELALCDSWRGGAVFCNDATAALEGCSLRHNDLYAESSEVLVESTDFRHDQNQVRLSYSKGVFAGCDFRPPEGAGVGYHGVVRLYASSPVLEDCTFTLNYSTDAAVVTGLHSSPVFERCVFINNYSWNGATIAELRSTDIGDPVFRGCTLFGRIDWTDDHAVFVLDDCWPLIENCILSFSGADEVLLALGNAEPVLTHSILYNIEGADELCGPGTVNLLADPLFCDVYTGDFGLCENSPCLPGGNPWGELVGALGQSCDSCSSPAEPTTWGAIKAMYR